MTSAANFFLPRGELTFSYRFDRHAQKKAVLCHHRMLTHRGIGLCILRTLAHAKTKKQKGYFEPLKGAFGGTKRCQKKQKKHFVLRREARGRRQLEGQFVSFLVEGAIMRLSDCLSEVQMVEHTERQSVTTLTRK